MTGQQLYRTRQAVTAELDTGGAILHMSLFHRGDSCSQSGYTIGGSHCLSPEKKEMAWSIQASF
ncbi:hypothetical protein AtDm6_2556 [Acetobacter tropicalis]|uniref:Uncharacterized protein n=2 Tax=Acetobacter TaxID=434 RepID=A0A094YNG4_9PROT|nr:hypothetical protein AtDm6_2556 [Acetobacter tropicalis]